MGFSDWLTDANLTLTVGTMNMNWKTTIQTAKDMMQDGTFWDDWAMEWNDKTGTEEKTDKPPGWQFLDVGADTDDEEDEDEDGDEYGPASDDDDDDDDDEDEDDDDDDSLEEEEEESEYDDDEEDDAEGQSWEELEREAKASDKVRKAVLLPGLICCHRSHLACSLIQ